MPNKEKSFNPDPMQQLVEAWSTIGQAAPLLQTRNYGTRMFEKLTAPASKQAQESVNQLKKA